MRLISLIKFIVIHRNFNKNLYTSIKNYANSFLSFVTWKLQIHWVSMSLGTRFSKVSSELSRRRSDANANFRSEKLWVSNFKSTGTHDECSIKLTKFTSNNLYTWHKTNAKDRSRLLSLYAKKATSQARGDGGGDFYLRTLIDIVTMVAIFVTSEKNRTSDYSSLYVFVTPGM